MHVPFVDLSRQEAVEPTVIGEIVKRGRFLGGAEVPAFECVFAEYVGAAHCIAVANGTDAIELALRARMLGPGDEVATVANAGMYATTAIRAIGASPVYIDIDPESLLMSPSALEAAANSRTRAVIVTHLYGQMARMPEILKVAERFSLAVIEDCSQAHGARMAGRSAGTWGTFGTFSFYPTKNLGAYGDAGAVITDDKVFCDRVRALREYGWTTRFHSSMGGGRNSRMDEIQAAVLKARLPQLEKLNTRRRLIAEHYASALNAHPCLRPLFTSHETCVAHLFVVCCERRDELRAWLTARGIQTQVHYPVPDHLQESQRGLSLRAPSLATTERTASEVLSIPCFPGLTDEEVEYVSICLRRWGS
jgi:dTDP-3-amino-2,3,6-trideoxy-4-keto-D-glucose/dTDP-3-amino-3,4,6-trideoxy-alpha-D-glucose/dTDP-2,6-dideoxy-D-kanosamine transaminase